MSTKVVDKPATNDLVRRGLWEQGTLFATTLARGAYPLLQIPLPSDANPFIGQTSSVTSNAALGEIYANGFRSPFRISVDPNNVRLSKRSL